MKKLIKLSFFIFISIFIISCGDDSEKKDPCDGVTCQNWETCNEGTCELNAGNCNSKTDCNSDQFCSSSHECLNNSLCGSCSNHGDCSDSNGEYICDCDQGYSGDTCSTCAQSYQDNDNNGTCLPSCENDQIKCTSSETCDDQSGTAVCNCRVDFVVENGECIHSKMVSCNIEDIPQNSTGVSEDVEIFYFTETGWMEIPLCEWSCDQGYQDNDQNGTCENDCSSITCGNNEHCDDQYGAGSCVCDEGFYLNDNNECVSDILMVTIPAGNFMMGCNETVDNECFENEYPYHQITLSSYRIDKYEVTVDQYQECIDAGICNNDGESPHYYDVEGQFGCNLGELDKGNHPVNCVSWYGAKTYCEWKGKRLPTEAEWERAARGTTGYKYPWGDTPAAGCDNVIMSALPMGCSEVMGTFPIGERVTGQSEDGVFDLLGNVWEWTADWYDSEYYETSSTTDPTGPENGDGFKTIRGGSWNSEQFYTRSSTRSPGLATERSEEYGFRCVQDID